MRIFVILIALFLNSCALTKKNEQQDPPISAAAGAKLSSASHQQQIKKLNNWRAQGKIAAVKGNEGGNARFSWQQRNSSFHIKLYGPFGSGAAFLSGTPNKVAMNEPNGNMSTAKTPEELMQKIAGWQVPLTGLRYWMRGVPTPNAPVIKQVFDNMGRLRFLSQEGWQIDYDEYWDDVMPNLPAKLNLSNRDLKVKVIIKSWNI